jgi:hypothetical protein
LSQTLVVADVLTRLIVLSNRDLPPTGAQKVGWLQLNMKEDHFLMSENHMLLAMATLLSADVRGLHQALEIPTAT